MEEIETSNNDLEKSDSKSEITDFEEQKDKLFEIKYQNVKEFCDNLSPDSVSNIKEFASGVEKKFGNEKVELQNGQKCSVWYYLLIHQNNKCGIHFDRDDTDLCCQVLKQDIEPTGWLTFFVCVSALFSIVIIGVPFFIVLGKKLMARNLHNDYKSLAISGYINKNFHPYKSPDYFLKGHNNSNESLENNFKSNDIIIGSDGF